LRQSCGMFQGRGINYKKINLKSHNHSSYKPSLAQL
jgi:hypothetical protein